MEAGRAEVHSSPGTIFFKTWSLQDLYWYDKKRSRASRRRVIDADSGRVAYGCKPCGLLTIDTSSTLPTKSRWRRGGTSER
jgi:hypothetical protein